MRALPFFKLSPGGNPTLLFVARLGVDDQVRVASECLTPLHLDAEQAGFVHPEKPALRMAGGEFCLNATRCLGLVLALEGRLPAVPAAQPLCSTEKTHATGLWRGKARTSGLPEEVLLQVRAEKDVYDCAVDLPLPAPLPHGAQGLPRSSAPLCIEVGPGMMLVRLPGISHLLLDTSCHPFPQDWRTASAQLRAAHGLDCEDAAGCIWWSALPDAPNAPSSPGGEPCWRCEPVVAVRHPHTVCRESACGSGSLALALALAHQGLLPQGAASIVQPSGMPISVRLGEHTARVSGPVRLLARGSAFVSTLPSASAPEEVEACF